MTEETSVGLLCPKDGTEMAPMGRRKRGGVYRCPTCRGVFLDVGMMRQGKAGQPPVWAPFVVSVLMSVGMTLLVRRLRHRPAA